MLAILEQCRQNGVKVVVKYWTNGKVESETRGIVTAVDGIGVAISNSDGVSLIPFTNIMRVLESK